MLHFVQRDAGHGRHADLRQGSKEDIEGVDIGELGLILVIGAVALVAFVVVAFLTGKLGRGNSSEPPPESPPRPEGPPRLRDRLAAMQQAGDWPGLLRLLDRTMPEWVVAGSLIETARELSALEAGVDRARANGVSTEVTGRLTAQIETVSGDLWSLADRIATADRIGSAAPREALEQHDEALTRLHAGMREAREGLAELSLADVSGADGLRRAEGRFRSLAATARELHEWEREQTPW
jgi:hypothetical protein